MSGGRGEQAWHIQYGGQPAGGMQFVTLAGPGATAYFSHGNRLRRVDVEKGIVTGRWLFPGSSIMKMEWKDGLIQIEVDEQLFRKPLPRVIDFDPESPDVPYWPTGSMAAHDLGMTEAHCCLTYGNTLIFASTVNVDQAKM